MQNMSKVFTTYCPNCGMKIQAVQDDKGGARLYCERCQVVVYSRVITPSKIRLEVTKI